MTAGRKLAADLHLVGEDGQTVVLPAGSTVPSEYKKLVTNPNVFVEDEDETVDPAIAEAEAAQAAADADAATAKAAAEAAAKAEVDAAQAQAQADADALAAQAAQAAANDAAAAAQAEAEAAAVAAAAQTVDYSALSFPDLQGLAKTRGLSGAGNTATLIARLEADDRDNTKE